MKTQSIILSVCAIGLFSGNGALAKKIHTFHYDPLEDPCGGVICTSDQFCNTENPDRPVCKNKLNLGEDCAAEGQCKPANSECLGDPTPIKCQCIPQFVEIQSACVPSCDESNGCQNDFFCHGTLTGCLPKVNLNSNCDETGGPSQCKTENAECLKVGENATCTCSADFVEKNGVCIAKCSDSSCSAIDFCETDSGLCKPKKPLGQTCTDSKECLPQNSACNEDKTCACESDTFIPIFGSCLVDCVKDPAACDTTTEYCSSKSSVCTRKANLHEGCTEPTSEETSSCSTEDAVCTPGSNPESSTCQCGPNFTESDSICVAVCTADVDCTGDNKFCNTDNGQCETKRELGQSCSATIKCSDDFQCPTSGTQVCSCKDGFIEATVGGVRTCIAKCTRNADCTEEGQFCSTTLGLCTPQLGLNGLCNIADVNVETNPCRTQFATCQGDDTEAYCLCDSDYVANGASCIAKCVDNTGCTSNTTFCHLPSGVCESKVPSLGETCFPPTEGTEQCLIANSTCTSEGDGQTCQCDSGYKERNERCDITCTESEQCAANEYCDHASSQFCMTKVGLNEPCTYEDQCSKVDSVCSGEENNKQCKCKTDYIDISGACRPDCRALSNCNPTQFCNQGDGTCRNKAVLNGPCEGDEECLNSGESTVCSSNRCRCKADDYYEEASMCLLKCTKTTGCNFTEQFCNSATFKCNTKADRNGACTEEGEEQCTSLATCEPVSGTTRKQCNCLGVAIASIDEKKCLKLATAIGDECKEPQQCSVPALIGNPGDVKNTTDCAGTTCDCSTEAVKADGKCYINKSIGYSCTEDIECSVPIVDGKCNPESQECDCNTDSTGSSSGKKCLKLATAIGDTCEEPQQCSVPALIGNPVDVTNTTDCAGTTCDCSTEAVKADGKCYINKSIGYSCTEDKECSVAIVDGKCNPESQECDCNTDSTGSSSGKKCLKLATAIGDTCEEPQQCSVPIADSKCNLESQECDCNTDFTGSSSGKKCLKLATAIGDPCEEPQQCSVSALIGNAGVTNTTQCATSKCDCAESVLKSEGKCYLNKLLGDVCTTDVECSVSISGGKCDTTSNQCVCSEGTEGSVGTKDCAKPNGGVPVNAKFNPVWILFALIASVSK